MVNPHTPKVVTFAHPIAQTILTTNEQTTTSLSPIHSLDSTETSSNADSPSESDSDETESDSELSVVESDISFDDDVYVLASETTIPVNSNDTPTVHTLDFLEAVVSPSL